MCPLTISCFSDERLEIQTRGGATWQHGGQVRELAAVASILPGRFQCAK
jgi:hypothetical protein